MRHRGSVADGDSLALWCVQRDKGTLAWKRPLGAGNVKMRKHNMSSPSPVTDGAAVYVVTGTGVLKSFSLDGRELWTRDLQKEPYRDRSMYDTSQSHDPRQPSYARGAQEAIWRRR